MNTSTDKLTLLIHKKITNQISEEESSLLEQLRAENDNVGKVESEVNEVWDASSSLPQQASFNKEAAYSFFLENVVSESTHINDKDAPKSFKKFILIGLLLALTAATAMYAINRGNSYDLADGSRYASLDAKINSDLYSSTNRILEIESGKAFFEVEKDADHPMSIKDADFSLTVLGTSFIMDADNNVVKVLEGKVKLSTNTETIVVTTGQAVRLINNKFETIDIDLKTESWISSNANFQDIPFTRAIGLIEAKYRINILYDTEENLDNCIFTSTDASNLTKEEMLTLIGKVYDSEVKRVGPKAFHLGFISCQ